MIYTLGRKRLGLVYLISTSTSSMAAAFSSTSFPSIWPDHAEQSLEQCFKPLSKKSHKGSSGRVGILGGSSRYTGAPYYAGMAALQSGADLVYVFCAEEAALPIKSYSPELMVTPVYNAKEFAAAAKVEDFDRQKELMLSFCEPIYEQMPRLHSLVIGPGLGRCSLALQATAHVIQEAMLHDVYLILDADALFMLSIERHRHLVSSYEKVILTPNAVEYKRLALGDDDTQVVSKQAIVIQKGNHDLVLKAGKGIFECAEEGGLKRSGGLGDILAGCCGTFMAWNQIMHRGEDHRSLACWTACCITKRATKRAFDAKRRAMTAPDVLNEIGLTMMEMETAINVKTSSSPAPYVLKAMMETEVNDGKTKEADDASKSR